MDLTTLIAADLVAFALVAMFAWSLLRVARQADADRDRHVRERAQELADARRSGRFQRARPFDRGRAKDAETAAGPRR